MSEQVIGTKDHLCHSKSIHGTDRQQSLISLIEEDTPNMSVVTCVELYHTYYKSNQSSMPAAQENSLAGGRAKECSPMKTEDCSGGARSKDECDRGANDE